jgi:hypothetical protein
MKTLIALINRDNAGLTIHADGTATTGDWALSENQIVHMTHVTLHETQSSDSHLGGRVLAVMDSPTIEGRYRIRFKPSSNVRARGAALNWGREKAVYRTA